MTDQAKTIGQRVGVLLGFVLLLSCFMGYKMGADVADQHNRQDVQQSQHQR